MIGVRDLLGARCMIASARLRRSPPRSRSTASSACCEFRRARDHLSHAHAEFLAVIQIVVYSGAILILFVFVIALLSSGTSRSSAGAQPHAARAAPGGARSASVGARARSSARRRRHGRSSRRTIPAATGDAGVFGSVADFGNALFTAQSAALRSHRARADGRGHRRRAARGRRDAPRAARPSAPKREPIADAREPIRADGSAVPVPVSHYVVLAAVMFFIGVVGRHRCGAIRWSC